MKQFLLVTLSFPFFMFTVSCNSKDSVTEKGWEAARDSICNVNRQLQTMLDDMTGTVAEISMGLDSITRQENMILRGVDEEGHRLTKKTIKAKLQTLSELIINQRERLAQMSNSLQNDNKAMLQLKNIIVYLEQSLNQKDEEIKKLNREIDSKDFKISQLSNHITNLKDTVAAVASINNEQQQRIKSQEGTINEVYYIIGTKKQLISLGIVSKVGTIIKKTKVNFSSIDKSVLNKADKRVLKTIEIKGKSPKILGEIPTGSYSLIKNNAQSTLEIKDVEKFWSANNKILVIQIK